MKFICLIVSTLLIVLINQHSINGLPVIDVTTEIPCLKGFELVDGKCHPITQELEFSTTEKSNEKDACPTGKIHNEHGICVDIVSSDQPATTVELKTVDELPVKIKSKSSNPTDEVEENTPEMLHSTVEYEHTTESLHHTHEKEEATESSHTEDKHLEHTTELSHLEDEHKEYTTVSSHSENEHEETTETSYPEDEHKEEKKKPAHRTKKLEEDATESSHLEDEHVEYTTVSSHPENEHEEEKTEEKPDTDDIPKGCPPGTKVDEQGECQDEVELKPKKASLNFKKISQDEPCPSDMEKYKGKCVYIKSKAKQVESVYDLSKSQTNEDGNNAGELVYQDANLGCPPGTEYFENNVCRKVIRPSADTHIEKPAITCGVNEVLINGKCEQKEKVVPLPSTVPKKTSKSTKDKLVKETPIDNEEEQPIKSTENKKIPEPEDEQS